MSFAITTNDNNKPDQPRVAWTISQDGRPVARVEYNIDSTDWWLAVGDMSERVMQAICILHQRVVEATWMAEPAEAIRALYRQEQP